MNCARCGQDGVIVGSACPSCGAVAVAVAADDLDSLLSLPAEAVEELDEQATGLPMLTVEPGSVGAATEVDETVGAPSTSFWDEPSLVGAPDPDWESDPDAWSVPADAGPADAGVPDGDTHWEPPPAVEAPLAAAVGATPAAHTAGRDHRAVGAASTTLRQCSPRRHRTRSTPRPSPG